MKTGDRVRVRDYSYAVWFKKGVRTQQQTADIDSKAFTVIATDCSGLPVTDLSEENNTILYHNETDSIMITNSRFLSTDAYCQCCGQLLK